MIGAAKVVAEVGEVPKKANGEARPVEPIARDKLRLAEHENQRWRLDASGYGREALADGEFWLAVAPKLVSFDEVLVIGDDWLAFCVVDYAEPGRRPIVTVERVRDRQRLDGAREMSALPSWLRLEFDEGRREFVVSRSDDGVVLVRHTKRLEAIQAALGHASVRSRVR